MIPASAAQFAASNGGEVPEPEQVRDGIWSVALPLPSGTHVPYTLVTLIVDERGDVHVIDPGWDSAQNRERLDRALALAGHTSADVASVTVTHLHLDHIALAEHLRSVSGAPVRFHEAEQRAIDDGPARRFFPEQLAPALREWGVPAAVVEDQLVDAERRLEREGGDRTVRADAFLGDGDLLDVPGHDIRVLHTPGHTGGHICLRDADAGLLWTGDHVLPTVYPGLGLGGETPGNPLADYLASLDRVAVFDDDEVLPGHGYRFRGVASRCADIAAHQLRRSAEVAAVLADDPVADVWTIASRLTWTAGWHGLSGFILYSALSQTAMQREYLATRAAAG